MPVILFGGQFSPSQIAGMTAWWKADAITSLNDGDAIDTWPDSSGAARNLTQSLTPRPLFKTNIKNSLPSVLFDDTNDVIVSAAAQDFFTVSGSTVFSVVHIEAGVNNGDTIWHFDNGATSGGVASIGGTHLGSFNNDGAGDWASQVASTNAWHIHTYLHNGTNVYSGVDDTRTASMVATASGNKTGATGRIDVGSGIGSFWGSYISEIIVYNAALSEDDRKAIESHLSSKWGIAIAY